MAEEREASVQLLKTFAPLDGLKRDNLAALAKKVSVRTMPAGRILRVETLLQAVVHWSVDDWHTVHDTATRDTTLGVHVADLETPNLRAGARVDFTFHWPDNDRWEGADFAVCVE